VIPPFESNGFLPPGIVDADLQEIESLIVRGNLSKSDLWLGLRQFLKEVSFLKPVISDIFIDGGFISIYPLSSDIDILVVVQDNYGAEQMADFLESFNPYLHGLDIKVSPGSHFPDPQGIHDYFASMNTMKHPELSGKKGYFRLKYE